MRYTTENTIKSLIKKIALPSLDYNCQDWEIVVANSSLVDSLLNEYIKREDLDEDEKFTLMNIIIESANDYWREYKEPHKSMDMIKNIIMNDYILHRETIIYYACFSVNLEDAWEITPYMRSIIANYDDTKI